MVLLPLVLIVAGLITVVYSSDEAIKRVMNLAKFFQLSTFVVSFVIAGIVAILPELSIGVLAGPRQKSAPHRQRKAMDDAAVVDDTVALEGTSSLGFGVILGANVADLTLVIGIVTLYAGTLKLDIPQH